MIFFFDSLSRKIYVSLKFDKNDGYFTWIPKYIFDIYLNSSYKDRRLTQKV